MKFEIDKNRWLYRQSFLVKAVVFFVIFFIANVIGQIAVDLLFGEPTILIGSSKDVTTFLAWKLSGSLVLAIFMTFLIGHRKTNRSGE